MIRLVVTAVYIVSGFHAFFGLLSVVVGVISSIRAEVWLAHSVSPIWSGGFFLITGILGVLCARKKSSYVIMCFTAFSVVSLVTAVVSIQLLRLGLVNVTTDGHTFQKENKDVLIFVALAIAASETIVCLVSSVLSCRIAKLAKEEMCKQRGGMFHVKEEGEEEDEGEAGGDDNPASLAGHVTDTQLLEEEGVELDIMSPRTAERTLNERPNFDVREIVRQCEATRDSPRSGSTFDVQESLYVTSVREPTKELWSLSNAQSSVCTEPVGFFRGDYSCIGRDSILPSIQS